MAPEQSWVVFSEIFRTVDENILLTVLRDAFWEAMASVRLWAEAPAARTAVRRFLVRIMLTWENLVSHKQ